MGRLAWEYIIFSYTSHVGEICHSWCDFSQWLLSQECGNRTAAASQLYADLRKKQRVSSESGEATPTSGETLPSSTACGLEEMPAIDVESVAGPSFSVMGASVTGPSTSSANLGAGVEGTGVTGSSASLESVPASLLTCLAWRE